MAHDDSHRGGWLHDDTPTSYLATSVFQLLLLAALALVGLAVDTVAMVTLYGRRKKRTAPDDNAVRWQLYAFLPSLVAVHMVTNIALVPMEILVDMDTIFEVHHTPCLVFGYAHALLVYLDLIMRTCVSVTTHSIELSVCCLCCRSSLTRRRMSLLGFNLTVVLVASLLTIPMATRQLAIDSSSIAVLPAFACIAPPHPSSPSGTVRFAVRVACAVVTLATLSLASIARLTGKTTREARPTPLLAGLLVLVFCYWPRIADDAVSLAGVDVPFYAVAAAKVLLHLGGVLDTFIYGFITLKGLEGSDARAQEHSAVVAHQTHLEMTRLPTYAELHLVVSKYQESRDKIKDDPFDLLKVPLD